MAIIEQIEEFTAFAKRIAEEHGEQITLDEVFHQWKESGTHPITSEIAILKERLATYDAGERGRSVDDFLAERRAARDNKQP